MATQRRRTSRQASAITGRRTRITSPFMPHYKGWKKPTPELLTEELAPLPVKNRIISPGEGFGDTAPHGGPSATGTGASIGTGIATGFGATLGAQGGAILGSPLGPLGMLGGSIIGAHYGSKLGNLGETKGEDVDPGLEAIGLVEASEADLSMASMGSNTYSGEMGEGGFGEGDFGGLGDTGASVGGGLGDF